MALIKPRTRGKQMLRHITRLDRENLETLHAYAVFLGEPTEYVINQVIDTVLARDKEFVAWRERHPEPFTPHPGHSTGAKGRLANGVVSAMSPRSMKDGSTGAAERDGRQATA